MAAAQLGTLILIPAPLSADAPIALLDTDLTVVRKLRYFVAERAKTARAILKGYAIETPMQELEIVENGKHADEAELKQFVTSTLQAGHDLGLLSEAGLPAVADPGAEVVTLAHKLGAQVLPLVGPSSLMLALMASGLGGQQFAVHGYLPVKPAERKAKLKQLEQRSRKEQSSQLWIETPYRNDAMLKECIDTLGSNTRICVATDLTSSTQEIHSHNVLEWRKRQVPDLHKRPTVFILAS